MLFAACLPLMVAIVEIDTHWSVQRCAAPPTMCADDGVITRQIPAGLFAGTRVRVGIVVVDVVGFPQSSGCDVPVPSRGGRRSVCRVTRTGVMAVMIPSRELTGITHVVGAVHPAMSFAMSRRRESGHSMAMRIHRRRKRAQRAVTACAVVS